MNGFHYFSRCSSLSFPPVEDEPQPQDPPRLAALVGTSALFLFLAGPYLGPLFNLAAHHLWNLFVYATPYWIVAALDTETKNSSESHISRTHPTFYEKERAMRRIIGLDRGTLDAVLPRGRRFSSLGHFSSPSRNLVPPGLGNWDNSCYQNSIIQGLASFRYFANYLDRNLRHLDSRRPLPTHHALQNILDRLNDPGNHGQKLWIPAELKSMSSWQQQDAQEYFSKLADQLDREVREASKIITTNSGLSKPGRQESCLGIAGSTSAGDDNEEADAADVRDVSATSIVHNPLEGLLAQRVGCIRCGWTEGLSLIPFNCLTVTLGREREYDVRDCLDEYMGLETIEGVECAKCTLLRAQDQLQNLVKQIDDDENIVNGSQSATVSSTLKRSAQTRLQAVQEALDDEDFTDKALSKKCHIPAKNRVSVTKSRQAVVARAPKNLVIHINRSVFDEETGALRKNHADVRFPGILDLGEWCLGTRDVSAIKEQEYTEIWNTNPQTSMLPKAGESSTRKYELRAVLTHFGRHENGHYICYRRFSTQDFPAGINEYSEEEKVPSHQWFRLSDEDVRSVSEQTVFNQGGVFMLFYESVDESPMDDEVLNHDLRVWNGPESKSFSKPGEQNDEGDLMQDALTSHGSDTSDPSLESDYSSARLTRTSSTNSHPSDESINVQESSEAGSAPA